MRIFNGKHVPWFIFVFLATIAASLLYVGNFHPDRMPAGIRLPPSLIQTPTEHHTVGGTPLGLAFGAIALGIFVFAALLSLRKKIPLWRVGTVQRWLRAHIWLTLLTIPLVILHSGFRLGGPMTTLLIALYALVMVSGIYGLVLQHLLPAMMKERLPSETVFEQIPNIRAQLCVAAEKMRDSLKLAPSAPAEKAHVSAPAPGPTMPRRAVSAVVALNKTELSTPVVRAGADTTPPAAAEGVAVAAATTTAALVAQGSEPFPAPVISSAANGIASPAPPERAETISPAAVPAVANRAVAAPAPIESTPAGDPASEKTLVEFIERQILPYLRAKRGERFRLGNARLSGDTFRSTTLRVSEPYRGRVVEIQGWCDARRLLDLQTRYQHWLHGWLFIHVPFSFLLLMLTIWHAYVTLFYY
jgi:hypothetical protein